MEQAPWVSFCISTYRRPKMLETQLRLLLEQRDPNFEIVISDNDPEESGKAAVNAIRDSRIRYWANEVNLGMIRSFNKAIECARTEYIVMVTDDDPVSVDFLPTIGELLKQHEGLSLYGGFSRSGKEIGDIEVVNAYDFIAECLDPGKTTNLLWSSVVLRKADVLKTGLIPDYGSPHLADHALLAKVGSVNGGLIVNKMFSTLSSHDTNFSKSNLDFYFLGCKGFYECMTAKTELGKVPKQALLKHLKHWFIVNYFTLRKYYILNKVDRIKELDDVRRRIFKLPYMKSLWVRFILKRFIFSIKHNLGVLKKN